jgi:hypothetical protein
LEGRKMGYSISIRVRSKRLHNYMKDFLKNNYRNYSTLINSNNYNNANEPGDDLSYDNSKFILGFDYSSCLNGWERYYIYSTLRWMAIKVGKKRSRFTKEVVNPNLFTHPIPYMVYDGDEAWAIIVCATTDEAAKLPTSQQWCAVDSLGMTNGPKYKLELIYNSNDIFNSEIKNKINKDKTDTIGSCPEIGDRLEWHNKYKEICLKYVEPEINNNLKIIRDELIRLDNLWQIYSYWRHSEI